VILSLLQSGDKVLAIDDVYGGTFRMFANVFDKFGIEFEQLDLNKEDLLSAKLQETEVKLLRIESPTNPLLKTTNLEQVLSLAKKYKVTTVVDNTFATPYFQQPLTL
jgi:cystathionine beta-lyase/cystathionine gamma-synthase